MLKNRATNKVLFVVCFTLYLKEDIDADGNVKPGVVGGIPFDKMDKELAEKHQRKKNGEDEEDEDEDEEDEEKVSPRDDDID